jgi:hypothetical protein
MAGVAVGEGTGVRDGTAGLQPASKAETINRRRR